MLQTTDNELMARYTEGSAEAFEELFHRYDRRAFAYFMRRTGAEERANDLSQELFLRLHRFRRRYDPDRPFRPWFFQIARHVAADESRRLRRRREVSLEGDRLASSDGGPEHQLDRRRRALEMLNRIPADQARLLVASKVEGREYAEIACRLGKSIDAVKQSASRAMRRLRLAEGFSV